MERRVTSHTEEEEMNQRRRLLGLARKGDEKAINKLFELYQVKIYTGDALKKTSLPSLKSLASVRAASKKSMPATIPKRPLAQTKVKKSDKKVKAAPQPKKPTTKTSEKVKAKPKVTSKSKLKPTTKPKPKIKPKVKAKPRKGK